jgi:uncharacterized DUF497 family protein
MNFEWDYNKAKSNKIKHDISFDIAKHIFNPDMMVKEDKRRDYQEKRYIGFNFYFGRCIHVVYTIRGDNIRIISMRRANERETKYYCRTIKSH